jgi:phage anti-repressor protein
MAQQMDIVQLEVLAQDSEFLHKTVDSPQRSVVWFVRIAAPQLIEEDYWSIIAEVF